jgi:hypothetical protein
MKRSFSDKELAAIAGAVIKKSARGGHGCRYGEHTTEIINA